MRAPEELGRAVNEARAAWPDIAMDPGALAEHVAAKLAAAGELAALRVGDLLVALACSQGDAAALRVLDERLRGAARPALARLGDAAFQDDALQELRLRLLVGPPPRILAYGGSGSLEAWLKVSAVRVALNLREREEKYAPPAFAVGPDDDRPLEGVRDPELDMLRRRYRPQVAAALRAAFADLDAAERGLLRLYAVDGLALGELARAAGTSRATAGRRLLAVRQKLLAQTRVRLGQELGLGSADLDSLVRLVRSELYLTLSGLLGSASE